jgi:hypothetical protein
MTEKELDQALSRLQLVGIKFNLSPKSIKQLGGTGSNIRGIFQTRISLELDGRQKSYVLDNFDKITKHISTELVRNAILNMLGGRFKVGVNPDIYGPKLTAIYWKAREFRNTISKKLSQTKHKSLVKTRIESIERKQVRTKSMDAVRHVFKQVGTNLRKQDILKIWQEIQNEQTVQNVMQS